MSSLASRPVGGRGGDGGRERKEPKMRGTMVGPKRINISVTGACRLDKDIM